MSESDRICPHCSMYACGTVGPEDMCDGALRAKLSEAEARAERYAAFIRKEAEANETCFRLDGREIHMRRAAYFRAALLPPPEPAGGEVPRG